LLRLLPPRVLETRYDHTDHTSFLAHSDGATGGVCKEQRRIHRAMMTHDY